MNLSKSSFLLISVLPTVILRMDEKSIEMYKKALAEGSVPDHSIRLMIVGHVSVGKTTLKRRLFEERVNIEERVSTQGIEVHVGRCKIDMASNNWIIHENDCRIEAVLQRLSSLLSLQESPSNPSKPTEDQFERNDNERSNLPTSDVNAQSENHHTLNLEKELPIEQAKQFIPHLPKMQDERKDKDANQKNKKKDKDSCLAHLKEILMQSSKLDKNQQSAELSIWDFAGQSEFYDMHQVFLSRRAVYLLVTKLSENIKNTVEDDFDPDCKTTKKIIEYIEFWLNSIYEHTQHDKIHSRARSNVILVGTFADKIREDCTEGSNPDFFDTVRMALCEKVTFASLTEESFRIDNTIDLTNQASEIPNLRKYILETASKQSYWGQKIPAKWCTLINVLLKLQNEGVKVLTKADIVDLSKVMPVAMQLDEIELFLNFHHESGNIIYYSHEEQLKETIILQPQWLIDALKSILASRSFCCARQDTTILWRVFKETAVLPKQLIDAIWNQEKYSEFKQQSTLVLLFMEKLGLIARPYQSVHQDGITENDKFLVPHFLKEHIPMEILKNNGKSTSKLCITTPSGFLPKTIFNKLLAVCIREFQLSGPTERKHIYCDGGVFDLEYGHQLFVCFYDNVIHIWLTRLSTDDHDVDESISLRISTFVLGVLKKDVHEVVESFKCRLSSIESKFKLKTETLQQDQEVICYCQEVTLGHPVETWEITKYWKQNSSKTVMHENTCGKQNTFVFNSGQTWQFLDPVGNVEKVSVVKAKGMVADAVCVIKGPTGMGTGFRVGGSYIMTAAHVIGQFSPMKGAFCDTSCYAEFNFIDKTTQTKRFYFKDVVYRNQNLDAAVIELLFDHVGDLPPAFHYFCPPVYDRPFCLIGHPEKNEMEINEVTKTINIDDAQNIRRFSDLQEDSKRISGNDYFSTDPTNCYLFLCKFTHGASGSPGFFVIGRDVYVTTMLIAGFPWWYYDERYAHLKARWRESDCVEQGVNMKTLYNSMQESNRDLCQEIFGKSRHFLQ